MRMALVFILLSMVCCSTKPDPVAVPLIVQTAPTKIHVAAAATVPRMPKPPVPPSGPEAVDAARLVMDEAAISLDRATDYVAWEYSTAPNIDRLTSLTRALRVSLAALAADRAAGVRSDTDLADARVALKDLQTFLISKED